MRAYSGAYFELMFATIFQSLRIGCCTNRYRIRNDRSNFSVQLLRTNEWCAPIFFKALKCRLYLVQHADIEALVLSGELFNGSSRSSSPARSPSPDAGWHDDEVSPEVKRRIEQGYNSDDDRRDAQKAAESQPESIGMGPGRTGVKGVIRDRDEAEAMERDQRSREVDELQRRMERSHLGGKTFLEEEREKMAFGLDKVDRLVVKELEASERQRMDIFGKKKDGRFGHLREVGFKGFVAAVEEKAVCVVHIYEPVNLVL